MSKKLNALVIAKMVDKISAPARKIKKQVKQLRTWMKLKGVDERWSRVTKRVEKLKKATKGLAKLSGIFTGMGAAAGFLFSKLAGGNGRVAKFAKQINWTTDQVQELSYAAKIMAGTGDQTFNMAMQRFTRRVAEAAAGTGEAQGALEYLGVQLLDSNGKIRNTSELLGDIATAMDSVKNSQTQNLIATKLFDSEGAKLVNLLNQGADAIKKYRAEAHKVGAVVDKKTLQQSEEYGDNVTRLTAILGGMAKRIQGLVLPTVIRLTDKLVSLVSSPSFNSEFMAGFKDFLATLRDIRDGITTVVGWVGGWKNAIIGLSAVLAGGVIFNFVALVAVVGKLVAAFIPLKAMFTWLSVAAALNPIGALVVAVAGAAALIYANWEPVKSFFVGLWDGIKSTFKSGITWIKQQVKTLTDLIPDFVKEPLGFASSMKVEKVQQVETITSRRQRRKAKEGRANNRTEVGGELHIKIDGEGRPRVQKLVQRGEGMGLRVDTGLAFAGS